MMQDDEKDQNKVITQKFKRFKLNPKEKKEEGGSTVKEVMS